jgi:hypothetical protein
VTDIGSFPTLSPGYDTVICLNVIEHVERDVEAMRNIRSVLAADGRAVILVPQGQWNYGTLDEVLGHFRRYSRTSLVAAAQQAGFDVEKVLEFNRFGTFAWFLNGRILRRRTFGLGQIKMLNVLVPVMRLLDRVLPTPPLSLIVILRPRPESA